VATGQQIEDSFQHDEWVIAAVFSPDGSRILTAQGTTGAIRLWQADSGALIRDFGQEVSAGAVAFSPDGAWAGIPSRGGIARLWKIRGGQGFGPPIGGGAHDDQVHALAFGPKGNQIVTVSEDRTARLWDVATGTQIGTSLSHRGPLRSVAWSPDGSLILTGCEDKSAWLWNSATQAAVGSPLVHEGRVQAVAFSPDSTTALAGSWDKTARLWDVATGKPVGPPHRHESALRAVSFDQSGDTMMTASDDGIIHIWDPPPLTLHADVEQIVLWAQVITGLELDETGSLRVLETGEWHRRRNRLIESDWRPPRLN
jgi:WD40 repeat protein